MLSQGARSEFTLKQSGQHTSLPGSYSVPAMSEPTTKGSEYLPGSSYSFLFITNRLPPHHPCLSGHLGTFGDATIKVNMKFLQAFSSNSWIRFTYLEKLHENDLKEVSITIVRPNRTLVTCFYLFMDKAKPCFSSKKRLKTLIKSWLIFTCNNFWTLTPIFSLLKFVFLLGLESKKGQS